MICQECQQRQATIHFTKIINGEKTTGITIMQTDKGMDSGDIIKIKEIGGIIWIII